ncbi:MAG: helix-turn-helix transcriptional regulator [Clostridia bacterium]|nr:helix-turn-helix transcriptional regulator [Clostridia bacterium]
MLLNLEKKLNISQKKLADRLQLIRLDIDKNAIQRIESGQRFVTDIEIAVLSNFFDVSSDYLINNQD